jgi:hypothetical protein
MRERWLDCSKRDVSNNENTSIAADVKQGELQYQESFILIPAFCAERWRKVNDLWHVSHLEVTTLNPAAQAGAVID